MPDMAYIVVMTYSKLIEAWAPTDTDTAVSILQYSILVIILKSEKWPSANDLKLKVIRFQNTALTNRHWHIENTVVVFGVVK